MAIVVGQFQVCSIFGIQNGGHDRNNTLAEISDLVIDGIAVPPGIHKGIVELLATNATKEGDKIVVDEERDAVGASS